MVYALTLIVSSSFEKFIFVIMIVERSWLTLVRCFPALGEQKLLTSARVAGNSRTRALTSPRNIGKHTAVQAIISR